MTVWEQWHKRSLGNMCVWKSDIKTMKRSFPTLWDLSARLHVHRVSAADVQNQGKLLFCALQYGRVEGGGFQVEMGVSMSVLGLVYWSNLTAASLWCNQFLQAYNACRLGPQCSPTTGTACLSEVTALWNLLFTLLTNQTWLLGHYL